jgi:uncharacterized protein involved in propanediol utilization
MLKIENNKPGSLFWDTLSNSKRFDNHQIIDDTTSCLIGYGKSFSSFGEIVQGRFGNNEDFLVTLPIDLWSTCELICKPIKGPLIVECEFEKSRSLLYQVLNDIGIRDGFYLECVFIRNIPIGKGLSSSTADMLAALRAIQEVFGLLLTESYISRLFASIEPHDGLHYNSCVSYNHRKGILLANYNYIPKYTILAVDFGGAVDTVQYNRNIQFSELQKKAFDQLAVSLQDAFEQKNDQLIANCATESANLYFERSNNPFVREALVVKDEFSPLGLLVTHSGTCVGFIYQREISLDETSRLVTSLEKTFDRKAFVVRTLDMLT